MRTFTSRTILAVGAAGLALAGAGAFARQATSPRAVIGSHQIDRFEAIRLLQRSLKANPEAVGDWVILGELAHEAALDLPSEQDNNYYRLSRQAYERALELDPDNAGLQAAVQFARDQENGAEQFDAARRRAARTYVDARRREMAQTNNAPTIQVEAPAQQPRRRARPADGDDDQPDVQDSQAQVQPYRTYRPFVAPQGQGPGRGQGQSQPYTYKQYQNSYLPPNVDNPQEKPVTLRQLGQQLPGALLQDVTRGVRPR